jgi:hypothetical protein
MRKIIALTGLSFVAIALGFAPISSIYAEVTGRIFRVTVKSSFGTTFTDCFRFDIPALGALTIDGLGPPITYRHGQLDQDVFRFKAVSRSGQLLSIMFFGEEVEGLEQLNGEAVNEFGDTFVFSGPEVPSCIRTLEDGVSLADSPYRQ